jgi:hypothetical protein
MITKSVVDTSVPPFHVMFPFTLTYMEKKEQKTCYFCAEAHLDKYLERYGIDRKSILITKTEERKSKKSNET